MAAEADPELIDLYARELEYLRERGAEFSQRYPKVAARLGIAGRQVADPHVERLIESFAFLTARLQHQLDRDLPELTTGLLGVLYPQYTSPIPSMAIASFEVDPTNPELAAGPIIEKGTTLFADASAGPSCRFLTAYPVRLWPLTVESAAYVPWDDLGVPEAALSVAQSEGASAERPLGAIRLRLSSGQPLRALDMRTLRFHISGDPVQASRLYDLLFERDRTVLISRGDEDRVPGVARIKSVGFGEGEGVLAYPAHAHQGYRLVQEYFAFPRKFLFFDVVLDERTRLPDGQQLELIILLDRRPGNVTIRKDSFQLGCTPVVNLFARTTEPIRVDQYRPEYRVVADVRRERYTEIHSILEVSATSPGEPEQRPYAPFFSYSHPDPDNAMLGERRSFWLARRASTGRADLPGSDVYLSFVSLDFEPQKPWSEVVYARALCTNRDLAAEIEAGAPLAAERGAPAARIVCLTKPTPPVNAPLGGQSLWRLVSNLSLSHLSLGGERGTEALREILRAYLFASTREAEKQIAAIDRVASRTVQRRVGERGWRSLCRGTEVTIALDEDQFGDSSAILFAEVLSRFLSLYAHLNSFTELVLMSTTRAEVWKRWPPMAGAKPLL
ncbi:Protein ImpG/VasA [Minicystis rosea]|nr:Protein ImpG/VasA [Minicystis rosea]